MVTLHLRYTINPNKLSDIKAYAEAELKPIRESGGKVVGYYLPTDFAGATNEAFGIIDFPSLAEYEICRAKLAAHPLHKEYVQTLERSGALLSIQRSLNRQQCAGTLQRLHVLLVQRMGRKLCTADLIFGERREINDAEGLIGCAGKIGGQVVTHDFAAALADRL